MLKRKNRISNFGRLENTINISSSLFTLKINNENQDSPKFGFIVSKKIDKRATVRNRTRRILQNAVKEVIQDLLPLTYLIIAKREIQKTEQENISKELKEILLKEKFIT